MEQFTGPVIRKKTTSNTCIYSNYNWIKVKWLLHAGGDDFTERLEERKLISLIKKKLSAGKDPEQIADEVEETVGEIQPIVDILKEHPEYDVDEVYERLSNEIFKR